MIQEIEGPEREKQFYDAVNRNELTVVHFKAQMFPACPRVSDLLKDLSADDAFKSALIVETDAEEVEAICKKFGVETVPTILFFCQGKVLDRVVGFKPPEITHKLNKYCTEILVQPGPVIVHQTQEATNESPAQMEERLKSLINKEKVMLFMKGTPETPRCGFSRKVVQILQDSNIEFGHFDILEDEQVRQGLKTYSNWQTYPQLYANGELVGGHDIIVELHQDGELVQALHGDIANE